MTRPTLLVTLDANAAARRGQFAIIWVGSILDKARRPRGVTCREGFRPERLFGFGYGDVIDHATARRLDYAATYNRTLLTHPGYARGHATMPLG